MAQFTKQHARGGAPKGNKNSARGREWSKAISKALAFYEDDKVKRGEALYKIAIVVVKDALKGDKDAYTEIGNRLDGRATEHVEIEATHRFAAALTDDELADIALGSRDGAAEEAQSTQEPSGIH